MSGEGFDYESIERTQLAGRLEKETPDNEHPRNGYALINVLDTEAFEKEHIPGSDNIPLGKLEQFERRFARDKEIIVYCASPDCDASPKAASQLAERGFVKIRDYEGGMSDWKEGGGSVVSGAAD